MGLKVIGIKKLLAQVYLSNFSLLLSETSVLSKQCCKKKIRINIELPFFKSLII